MFYLKRTQLWKDRKWEFQISNVISSIKKVPKLLQCVLILFPHDCRQYPFLSRFFLFTSCLWTCIMTLALIMCFQTISLEVISSNSKRVIHIFSVRKLSTDWAKHLGVLLIVLEPFVICLPTWLKFAFFLFRNSIFRMCCVRFVI